jgi:hypothetical protein
MWKEIAVRTARWDFNKMQQPATDPGRVTPNTDGAQEARGRLTTFVMSSFRLASFYLRTFIPSKKKGKKKVL